MNGCEQDHSIGGRVIPHPVVDVARCAGLLIAFGGCQTFRHVNALNGSPYDVGSKCRVVEDAIQFALPYLPRDNETRRRRQHE